MNKLVYINLLK